jgi:hypothetical protein
VSRALWATVAMMRSLLVADVSAACEIVGAVRALERKATICVQTIGLITDIILESGLLWLDLLEASRIMIQTFVRVDCPEEEAACC